jgi:hypothetical protein
MEHLLFLSPINAKAEGGNKTFQDKHTNVWGPGISAKILIYEINSLQNLQWYTDRKNLV